MRISLFRAFYEDTRVDGVLGLFHELFEEGFEG